MSSTTPNTNVIDFEGWRKKLRPTDEELMIAALENLSDDDIDRLLIELQAMLDIEEPANDCNGGDGIDSILYQTYITFSPEGEPIWSSDWNDLDGEDVLGDDDDTY